MIASCLEKPPGPLYPFQFAFYRRSRAVRLRFAASRYRGILAALSRRASSQCRAALLERMARWAGHASGLEHREPDTETWAIIADLARAVAATERTQVLSGLWIEVEDGLWNPDDVEYRYWGILWDQLARTHADRRAQILSELADTVISPPAAAGQDPSRCSALAHVREAVALLRLIAGTEIAAARIAGSAQSLQGTVVPAAAGEEAPW